MRLIVSVVSFSCCTYVGPSAPLPLPRPNELTTVEFGKGWKSVAHEKRQKMETTLTEPSDIQVKLKECLNFHPVEVISESLKTCATNCHASVEHAPLV